MARGALRPGDRVQSLRELSRQQHISISTALQAYLWLESRGYLEARPQSGFYVRTPFSSLIPEPQFQAAKTRATTVGPKEILTGIIEALNDPSNIPFGAGSASPELFPNRRLNLILRRIVHRNPYHSTRYEFPAGVRAAAPPDRAPRHRDGMHIFAARHHHDMRRTGGDQPGDSCCRAPGDAVAVESPTYFGILQSAGSMGMKVIEIPTHPQDGMDLDQLDAAIRKHRVKACIAMSNCHNPLGYALPDKYKKALAELTARRNIALIEDEVYGDLTFSGPRPRPVKSFDRKGNVLVCSSFSKILSPGYRLGWVMAGRYRAEVERLKMLTTVATPSLPQMVVAEFLETGGYDRHLNRLRTMLHRRSTACARPSRNIFPKARASAGRPADTCCGWSCRAESTP